MRRLPMLRKLPAPLANAPVRSHYSGSPLAQLTRRKTTMREHVTNRDKHVSTLRSDPSRRISRAVHSRGTKEKNFFRIVLCLAFVVAFTSHAQENEALERIEQESPSDLTLRVSGGESVERYRASVSTFLWASAALVFVPLALWFAIYFRSETLRRRGLRSANWASGVHIVNSAVDARGGGARTYDGRTFRPT